MNYTFRMHDPRVGRFFAVDPLFREYPHNSPYAFAENDLIAYAELEGAEKTEATNKSLLVPTITTTRPTADLIRTLANNQMREALVEEGGKQVLKREAAKGAGKLILTTVARYSILIFCLFSSYDSPDYYNGKSELDLHKIRAGEKLDYWKIDKKLAVPDYKIKEKTIEELPIVTIAKKLYSKHRPSYGKDLVEEVWENAKQSDGNVYDPNTGEILKWDRTKPRQGQWDMGHIFGKEYKKLHDDYMSGKITKEAFLKEYRNSKNYQPESPSANRSGKFEKKEP